MGGLIVAPAYVMLDQTMVSQIPNPANSFSPQAAVPDQPVPVQQRWPDLPSQAKVTEFTPSTGKLQGVVKLALLILLPIGLAVGGALAASGYFNESTYRQQKGVLVAIPMHNTNWQDLGFVFEPLMELPVETTTGYQTNQFLLDSGAVISSLPREWAEKTGQDLAFLPRSTFRGFGGTTSLAYQGEMNLLFGEEEVTFPVVFTEAVGTKSLLGRKGFFENYSIYFNHQERQIEVRE